MFNRAAYKNIAKKQLQGRWGTPVLATLITIVIMTALGSKIPVIAICASAVLNIANVYLFITLSHTKEKQPFSTFIQGFSHWLNGILSMLWVILWTFLWMLLFVIPGIVKFYSYSQIFFIITEYPDMDVRTAMNLSKKITKGYKMDLFVMDLSFIGWLILTGFTGGILGLWVFPYMTMARVNAYHSIKQQALESGTVKESDFMAEGKAAAENPNSSSEGSSSASTSTSASSSTATQYNWDTSNAEDAETVRAEKNDEKGTVHLGSGVYIEKLGEQKENPDNNEGTF
ncbi:MAG: DUF975 family protein [Treponema sp.]|nr:DUF975 family protein [Treponema sp.]